MTRTSRRPRRTALLLAGIVAAVGAAAAVATGSPDPTPSLPDHATPSSSGTSVPGGSPSDPGTGYDDPYGPTGAGEPSVPTGSPDIDGIVQDSYDDMWGTYRDRIGGW